MGTDEHDTVIGDVEAARVVGTDIAPVTLRLGDRAGLLPMIAG